MAEEAMVHCEVCGLDLFDGDPAYGLTTGRMNESCEGFMPCDDPWVAVLCRECGALASDAVWDIDPSAPGKSKKIQKLVEACEAALDTIKGLLTGAPIGNDELHADRKTLQDALGKEEDICQRT